jgi:hypothetical protein
MLPFPSLLLRSSSHLSSNFCLSLLRFLALHPNGDTLASKGFLSIFLHIDETSKGYQRNKQVKIDFTLRILNHDDPGDTFRCDFKNVKFGADGNLSWGHANAFLQSRVTEPNGFLKDNTLTLKAELSLRKTKWKL